jgi:hypothetical protein
MMENHKPLDYANHHIFTSIGMLYSYQTDTEESRIGIRQRYPFDQDSGNVHLLSVFSGSCEVEIPRICQARPKHDDVPYATDPAYPTYPTPFAYPPQMTYPPFPNISDCTSTQSNQTMTILMIVMGTMTLLMFVITLIIMICLARHKSIRRAIGISLEMNADTI